MARIRRDRNAAEASATVLLVEDEPLLALVTQTALEEAGYVVRLSRDGSHALDQLDSGCAVFTLVTDIKLGRGPDGWQVAEHARRRDPNLRVVYLTGDSGRGAEQAVGGSVLLQKPVSAPQLLAAIATAAPCPLEPATPSAKPATVRPTPSLSPRT